MRESLLRLLQDRRVRYIAVGAWNTVFGYLAFVALYLVLAPRGVHYLAVLVVSQIVGLTNAYLCYKVFVFRTRGNIVKEYLRFYLVYGFTFVVNIALMTLFVEQFHLNAMVSQGIIAVVVVVVAYLGHSNFSFSAKQLGAPGASRNIVITGASRGIGAALACHYAGPGARLGLVSRDSRQLALVARSCEDRGATVHSYIADVRDGERMRACALDFLSRAGTIDIVIANAGIRLEEDEDVQDCAIARELVETNYLGVVNTLYPYVPAMKAQRSGRLAVVSSIGAIRATPNSGAYSASKAAVTLWTEGLRQRLRPFGVTLTCLICGFVDTAMTRSLTFWMPGLLTPEEAAVIMAGAIDGGQRLVIFPWQSRLLWSFFAMLPGPLYDVLILWAKDHYPRRSP